MIRLNLKVIAIAVVTLGSFVAMDAQAKFLCGKWCQKKREQAVQNAISIMPCFDPGTGAKRPDVKVFNPDRSKKAARVVRRGKVALPPGTVHIDEYEKMCGRTQQAATQPAQPTVSPYGTAPNYPGYYYGNQGGAPGNGFTR